MFILYFFLWTFVLYWIHRIGHRIPIIQKIHWYHHRHINANPPTKWHWNNIVLFNDNWISTADLWITEVIPTIIFGYLTGQYWILIFYYIWAAVFQETLEHNSEVDIHAFTSGKWHLIHHQHYNKNYGLFFPLWDVIFNTYKSVK